ncbi:MAG: DUF3226 domain-containing protein [Thermodesulfobacteriota bacterium]
MMGHTKRLQDPMTKKAMMIGEGRDDANVLKALRDDMGLTASIHVRQYGGKNNLPDFLMNLRDVSGFRNLKAIGITRDADADPKGAFQSVQNALSKAGFPVPGVQMKIVSGKPEVSVLILPDGRSTGCLEDLCRQAVCHKDAAVCVDRYLQCLRDEGVPLPAAPNDAKTWVRAYLASCRDPGKRPGEAAFAGYWPWDSQVFDQLKRLIRQIEPA